MSSRSIITLGATFFAASILAIAGANITKTMHVSGNCKMCKKNIEKPLKSLDGIETASWDKDTKQLTVTFDPEQITEKKILETVAGAGYDSDSLRASDEVYSKLPKCCKYRDGGHGHE
ncbi:hypothetical protein MASR2M18_21010 [Ignavibacteria bacterium]|nr:heavy-metal-associated domain-containing protein [Bacteroidota bacterium]MCZ2131993.1 cation transporter [Bacteroidota bacterium]